MSIKDDYVQMLSDHHALINIDFLKKIIPASQGSSNSSNTGQYAVKVLNNLKISSSNSDEGIQDALAEYFDLTLMKNGKYHMKDVHIVIILRSILRVKKYRSQLLFMGESGWQSFDANTFREISVAFLSLFLNSELPGLNTLNQVYFELQDDNKIPKVVTTNEYMQFHDCMYNIRSKKTEPFKYDVIPRIRYDMPLGDLELRDRPPQRFQNFIRQVTCEDTEYEEFLYKVLAYIVSPMNTGQYNGIFFYGDGANGKSVLLDVIKSFFITSDISTKNLSALNSRFGLSGLDSKHMILSHESSKVSANSTALSALKNILTDRMIHIEEKGKDGRDAEVELKVIMATNEQIFFDKASLTAMQRRIIILPFANVIPEHQRDPNLLDNLLDEKVEIMAFLLKKVTEMASNNFQLKFPSVVAKEQAIWFSSENTVVSKDIQTEIQVTNWIKENLSFTAISRIEYNGFHQKVRNDISVDITSNLINKIMEEKFGISIQKSNGHRYWKGVQYRSESKIINPFQKFKE